MRFPPLPQMNTAAPQRCASDPSESLPFLALSAFLAVRGTAPTAPLTNASNVSAGTAAHELMEVAETGILN